MAVRADCARGDRSIGHHVGADSSPDQDSGGDQSSAAVPEAFEDVGEDLLVAAAADVGVGPVPSRRRRPRVTKRGSSAVGSPNALVRSRSQRTIARVASILSLTRRWQSHLGWRISSARSRAPFVTGGEEVATFELGELFAPEAGVAEDEDDREVVSAGEWLVGDPGFRLADQPGVLLGADRFRCVPGLASGAAEVCGERLAAWRAGT